MARSHEDFVAHELVRPSSHRSFGVFFCMVFSLVGMFPLLTGGTPLWWALVISIVIGLLAALRPGLLAPPNRIWTRLAQALHSVVNPVVMGVMYFGVVWPTGLLLRLAGKDPLRQRRDPRATTYWIEREPPAPDHFKNQY